jgi:hypothetical protein
MKSIIFGTAFLALVVTSPARADDYHRDHDRDRDRDSHVEVHGDVRGHHDEGYYVPRTYHAPNNLRIVAASREDQWIVDQILRRAIAERVLGPGAPPVSLNVRNGRVHWYGTIVGSRQHRDLIAITRHVRGVRDINDELRAN